jgi:hypothetical protein
MAARSSSCFVVSLWPLVLLLTCCYCLPSPRPRHMWHKYTLLLLLLL